MIAPDTPGTPAETPPLVETIRRFEGIPAELVRLTTQEAAAALGLQAKTLEGWRVAGKGPAFCKIGRAVTYRLVDLLAFIEGARYGNTREAKTARRMGRAAA